MEAILLMATLAVTCGADNWIEVEYLGHQKQAWLETSLKLPHGIPSHDQTRGVSPLHSVSAGATPDGLPVQREHGHPGAA